MPPDYVKLLKLVWHPDDLEGDQLKPTAFRKQDLSGEADAHISVDRDDIAEREVMEAIANTQAAKSNNADIVRDHAMIGTLLCKAVREISYGETPALQVVPFPLEENPAHCGIQNISGTKGRGFLNEIRGKLARLASPAISFDDAYE